MNRRITALPLGATSTASIALVSVIGVVAFGWPLIAAPDSVAIAHAQDAPWLFALLIPAVLLVVLASIHDGVMDAKAVAMLGVLSAVVAVLRPLGGGTAGLEPIWVIIVLAGRALGPGFGFTLGATSLFASAVLTGGVGPWLPFQMLGAAWVGLGAGLLPPARGRAELGLLTGYAALACLAYGLVLNLWLWPFTTNLPAAIAFAPGAPLVENLLAWLRFTLVTSLGWDIPRALLTIALIWLAGPVVLTTLRRAGRRASFQAPATFEPAQHPAAPTTQGA
jgi:energy-coupling factor transport system substrate-specific component